MAYGHRGKRDAPFSLRLTFEERARLIDDAGMMPLAAYIKSLIFREDAPKYRTRRRGSPEQLEPVEAVKKAVRARVTEKLKSFIAEVKTKHAQDAQPLLDEKAELVAKQRAERAMLKEQQERRWKAENKARSERLRTGFKGLLDTLTGRAKGIRTANEADAYRAAKRDQEQRDELVLLQMEDRQELQIQFAAMRKKQAQDRRLLARDVVQFLHSAERRSGTDARRSEQERTQEANRPRTGGRDRGPRFEL